MAQSGFTPLQLYYSSTPSSTPLAVNLTNGELALNITDGKLFYKDNGGVVQTLAYKITPISAGGTGQTTASAAFNALSPITSVGDLIVGDGVNSATRLPIGTNGYILTSNGTTVAWSPSPATGVTSFQTSLDGLSPNTSTTGSVTLSGTLGAISGGTGLTSYTTGDILYASAPGTLTKLNIGSSGQYLTVSGGGLPEWTSSSASGVTSFQTSLSGLSPSTSTSGAVTLSGILGVVSGGTGTSSITGVLYGNGTSAFSAATGNQIVSAIGSTAVANATNAVNATNATTATTATNATNATNATTATNVASGAANQILYQTASGTTGFIAAPSNPNYSLAWNGSSFTWVPTGSATTAISIAGGTTGALPYQTAASSTSFINIGTAGQVLTVVGGLPVWQTPSSPGTGTVTSVGLSAPSIFNVSGSPVTGAGTLALSYSGTPLPIANGGTNATTASAGFNNLSPITSVGDLIVGNGVNSATRLAIGANTYVLTSNGTTASWQPTLATGVTTFQTSLSGLSPNTSTSGAVTLSGTLGVASGGTGSTSLSGVLFGNGASAFSAATGAQIVAAIGSTAVTNATNAVNATTATTAVTATTATNATNLSGGSTGSIAYQSGSNATTFLSLGTTNYVLTAGASAPQYVAQSTLSVGSATTATTATTATNVAGGATGSLLYQSGSGTTTSLALGTSSQVLVAGGSAPQYVDQSTLSVGSATTATTATNLAGGANGSLPYQTGSGTTTFLAAGTNGQVLTLAGGVPTWAATSSGVSSFSAGATGLTPSSPTGGAVTLAGTLNVASGGTGVTTSSGANSVVLRDSNQFILANNFISAVTSTASTGGTTVLASTSSAYQVLTGTLNQTYRLPAATSLPVGLNYQFNNNSTGTLTIADNGSNTLATVPSGGLYTMTLLSNVTANGVWDKHAAVPATANWGTATLTYSGTIASATWNGNTIDIGYGGTGITTYTTGDILYASASNVLSRLPAGTNGQILTLSGGVPSWQTASSGVSSFSAGTTGFTPSTSTTGAVTLAGTLATTNGGTGLTSFTANGAVYATSTSALTTGTLPVGAGGTGQTTTTAAFNALSPITSTGDLIIGTGSNSAGRLGIGTNGYILTSNGTTATWAAAPASMIYPGAGIAVSTGSAWTTSLTAPSGSIVGTTDTQTLTNKRINPRVSSTTTAASLTPDISSYDQYCLTALNSSITFNAPTGTPVDGNKLLIRVNATGPWAYTWNAIYQANSISLPTTATTGLTTYIGFIYNASTSKWDLVATA